MITLENPQIESIVQTRFHNDVREFESYVLEKLRTDAKEESLHGDSSKGKWADFLQKVDETRLPHDLADHLRAASKEVREGFVMDRFAEPKLA